MDAYSSFQDSGNENVPCRPPITDSIINRGPHLWIDPSLSLYWDWFSQVAPSSDGREWRQVCSWLNLPQSLPGAFPKLSCTAHLLTFLSYVPHASGMFKMQLCHLKRTGLILKREWHVRRKVLVLIRPYKIEMVQSLSLVSWVCVPSSGCFHSSYLFVRIQMGPEMQLGGKWLPRASSLSPIRDGGDAKSPNMVFIPYKNPKNHDSGVAYLEEKEMSCPWGLLWTL